MRECPLAEIEVNAMAPGVVDLGDERPILHFSERRDAVFWPLEPVRP